MIRFYRSFPKNLSIKPMMLQQAKDYTDGSVKTRPLQGELRNHVHLSNLWCRHAAAARASMKNWCFAKGYAAISKANCTLWSSFPCWRECSVY